MRRADNLTTFVCRFSLSLGPSSSWNPLGLSRPVMGLLYLYSVRYKNYPPHSFLTIFCNNWSVSCSCACEITWTTGNLFSLLKKDFLFLFRAYSRFVSGKVATQTHKKVMLQNVSYKHFYYEGHLESKERFAIKKYLLIIGKKKNMQVLSHTFTYFST